MIGGGSGGSPVASRLSEEKKFSVLLLEAGLDEPASTQVPSFFRNYLGSDIDWNYETESEEKACLNKKDKKCTWPRGKVKGQQKKRKPLMNIPLLPSFFPSFLSLPL